MLAHTTKKEVRYKKRDLLKYSTQKMHVVKPMLQNRVKADHSTLENFGESLQLLKQL